MDEVQRLKEMVNDLKTCLKRKECEIQALQAKIRENKHEPMTKDEVEKFIKGHLPMLTENQIKLMTGHKKRVNWTRDELSKGFTSAFFSQQGHKYWINGLKISLPAIRTLNSWAAKMVIAPGILSDVLLMLEGYAAQLTEGERQVILSFDEMACKALTKYHKGLDQVLGPNKEMQVIMVRGLKSKFKQPIYVNFDTPMTKKILYEVIAELNRIRLNVVGIVSDCGGSNVGLWKEMDIICSRDRIQYYFKHPITGENIYVFADAPHMLKLIRNWFLDFGFVLKDGSIIKKHKVYELLHKVNSEISPGFKLSEAHFDCSGTERMNVRLAAELLSHTTATCLRRYFPDDSEATKLADFIDLINQWFDIMNSYTAGGPWYKRAYGMELKHQEEVLDKMYSTIQSMKCYDSENKLREPIQTFQKGILFSIKSLKALFCHLQAKLGFRYILTHRLNQDCLENFFSQIRGKTRFKEHPNCVECLYNIRAIILGKNPGVTEQLHTNTIDKLPDEYVTSEFCKIASKIIEESSPSDSLANELVNGDDDEGVTALEYNEDNISEYEQFEELSSMSSDDGIEYIAGWIQKKLSYGNPILSRAQKADNTTQSNLQTSFVNAVSQGGLTKPDDLILNMVKNMENEFFKIHGKTFTKQLNIRKNLVSTLKQKYPEIPIDMVNLFARSRIYFRCNYLNKIAHEATIIARIEKRKAKAEALKAALLANQQIALNDPLKDSLENVSFDPLETIVPKKKSRKRSVPQKFNNVLLHPLETNAPRKKCDKGSARKNINSAAKDALMPMETNSVQKSRKRAANVAVYLMENENIDNIENVDVERKKQRKLKKFVT